MAFRIGADHSVESPLCDHDTLDHGRARGWHSVDGVVRGHERLSVGVQRSSRRKEPGSTRAGSCRRQSRCCCRGFAPDCRQRSASWSRLLAGPAGCCPAGHGTRALASSPTSTGPRQTLLGAAGAWIARQVHHGRAEARPTCCPLFSRSTRGPRSHLGKCLGQHIGIPGLAQARGLRKLGRRTAATPAARPTRGCPR